MTAYVAVPALPAEQQDPVLNPSGNPLGWVVVRASDDVMMAFGDGYMEREIAEARARTLNAGRPGTDVPNV
jgi:hypothetical protein